MNSPVEIVPDGCTPLFSVLGAPPKPLGVITGRVGNGVSRPQCQPPAMGAAGRSERLQWPPHAPRGRWHQPEATHDKQGKPGAKLAHVPRSVGVRKFLHGAPVRGGQKAARFLASARRCRYIRYRARDRVGVALLEMKQWVTGGCNAYSTCRHGLVSALAFEQATTPFKAPTQSLIIKVQSGIACKPIPPPIPHGCVIGACVCDQHRRCQWTKICTDR